MIYAVCPLVFEFSVWYSLDLTCFENCRRKFCRLLFGSERLQEKSEYRKTYKMLYSIEKSTYKKKTYESLRDTWWRTILCPFKQYFSQIRTKEACNAIPLTTRKIPSSWNWTRDRWISRPPLTCGLHKFYVNLSPPIRYMLLQTKDLLVTWS